MRLAVFLSHANLVGSFSQVIDVPTTSMPPQCFYTISVLETIPCLDPTLASVGVISPFYMYLERLHAENLLVKLKAAPCVEQLTLGVPSVLS